MEQKTFSSRLVNLMGQAGLKQSVAHIYEFILSQEFVTKGVIEQHFESYDIEQDIRKLLELKIISIDMERDKFVLYAINPDLAWGSVSNDITWRFHRNPKDYEKVRPHYALPSQFTESVQHARNVINTIREIAVLMYESSPSVARHRWREALDKEHLAILLSEAILQGNSTIYCVTRPPRSSQLSIIWESVVQRMKEGVIYRRVTNLTEVIEHGLYIIKRDIEDYGVDLRILDLDEIEHKFYVIDRKFLVVYHLTGANQDQQIGRVTREKNTIKRYHKRFSKYYEQAVPGLFVVQQLRQASTLLLRTAQLHDFNEAELSWIKCLINWGVFCNLENPSLTDLKKLEDRTIKIGIAEYGSTGKLVPKYGVSMQSIKRKWLNTQTT